MRRVVFNQKGGVGKSSITVNLAALAARAGRRTLVIDLDPQCNASQYLLGMGPWQGDGEGPTPNIGSFFASTLSFRLRERPAAEYLHATTFPDLFLLPSNPELREVEHLLESKHKIYKLRDLVRTLSRDFDQIWIDTPPAFNFYTLSALIAAERVLIPFDCDAFARQALYGLMRNIEEVRADHNDRLQVEGVIINQFQPRARLPRQMVEALAEEGMPVLPQYLSSSVVMRESRDQGLPLAFMAPTHKMTREYEALYQALQG